MGEKRTKTHIENEVIVNQNASYRWVNFVSISLVYIVLLACAYRVNQKSNFILLDKLNYVQISILISALLASFYLMIILPFKAINIKRKLILSHDHFTIISNKEKFSMNVEMSEMKSWTKSFGEVNAIRIEFNDKKLFLSNYEFKNLYVLEDKLKKKYSKKQSQ